MQPLFESTQQDKQVAAWCINIACDIPFCFECSYIQFFISIGRWAWVEREKCRIAFTWLCEWGSCTQGYPKTSFFSNPPCWSMLEICLNRFTKHVKIEHKHTKCVHFRESYWRVWMDHTSLLQPASSSFFQQTSILEYIQHLLVTLAHYPDKLVKGMWFGGDMGGRSQQGKDNRFLVHT